MPILCIKTISTVWGWISNFPSTSKHCGSPPGAPDADTTPQQSIALPCSSHNKLVHGAGAASLALGTCAFLLPPKKTKGRKSVSLCTHSEIRGHIPIRLFTLSWGTQLSIPSETRKQKRKKNLSDSYNLKVKMQEDCVYMGIFCEMFCSCVPLMRLYLKNS